MSFSTPKNTQDILEGIPSQARGFPASFHYSRTLVLVAVKFGAGR